MIDMRRSACNPSTERHPPRSGGGGDAARDVAFVVVAIVAGGVGRRRAKWHPKESRWCRCIFKNKRLSAGVGVARRQYFSRDASLRVVYGINRAASMLGK